MQNLAPSHPYVDSVSMNGNQIDLSVEVTDFKTTKGSIEISGQATQVGGALAMISQVVDFTKDATEEPDGYFVTVTANVVPPIRFKKDDFPAHNREVYQKISEQVLDAVAALEMPEK